jgi:hypothetical protein
MRANGLRQMTRARIVLLFLLCAPQLEFAANGDEGLYPGIPRCDIYQVRIISSRGSEDLAVFQNACPKYEPGKQGLTEKDQIPLEMHSGRSISWASFDLAGPVIVEVEVIDQERAPSGKEVRIIPSRHKISPKIQGDTIRFTMNKPGQCSVEIGPEGYKNGLMIFADPPETDAPNLWDKSYIVHNSATQAEVKKAPAGCSGIYFKRGTHDIGIYRVPKHIKNIYLEKGAWVDGALILEGNEGARIFGRGVLSSRKLDYRSAHGIEAIKGSHRLHIEGIVVADFKHYALRLISTNNTVKWVKTIGAWVWNADGISVRDGSKVMNCFIWANDDAIKAYRHDILFSDIVVWQLDNGGTIQMSWGDTQADNVVIRRIDLLHAEWSRPGFNRGLINCVGNRYKRENVSTLIRNWLIEDVVTETPIPVIFKIDPDPYSPVHIKNLTLRDWNVKMKMGAEFQNRICGNDPAVPYSGFRLENIIFNGTQLTSINWRKVTQMKTRNLEEPVIE